MRSLSLPEPTTPRYRAGTPISQRVRNRCTEALALRRARGPELAEPWRDSGARAVHTPGVSSIEEQLLRECPVVAVLGAHEEPQRAAYYVPKYLVEHGYEVWPVNPTLVGRELFGHRVVGTLAEVPVAVDFVDVFRRPEHLPAHVDDILAMSPRPRAVWFQLGIVNDAVAATLRNAGLTVVQDRCTLAEHRRLRLGRPVRPG